MPRSRNNRKKILKNKPKQKTVKSKTNTQRNVSLVPSVPRSFIHGSCSITNPFCDEAIGARWPDNSYTKSNGWSATSCLRTIVSNATGSGCELYLPSPQGIAVGSVTAGVCNYTSSYAVTSPSTPPSGVARWRVTSWGVSVSAPYISPMNAAGLVSIRLISPLTGSPLGAIDAVTQFADSKIDIPLAKLINTEQFVVPMPLGEMARLFVEGSSFGGAGPVAVSSFVNPGWQCINVAVTGTTPSTACLLVKLYYNFEIIFNDGEAASNFSMPPPHDSPILQKANSGLLERVGNFIEGSVSKVDALFSSKAFQIGSHLLGYATGAGPGVRAITAGSRAMHALTVD